VTALWIIGAAIVTLVLAMFSGVARKSDPQFVEASGWRSLGRVNPAPIAPPVDERRAA
jgi:hypothetical protein